MKNILLYLTVSAAVLAGCSSGNDSLEAKKEKVAEYKKELHEINVKIRELESEIASLEGVSEQRSNAILVNTSPVQPTRFTHAIDVRGNVASRTNVFLSSETGGAIQQVRVSEGNVVKKGDILVTIDNAIIRNNIAEVKTALELAEAVFERQSNLWEKKIGTEIQYLEAKNRKESLERQLTTLETQLSKTIIRAPFAGSVDAVEAKVGQMAQPGMPLVQIVNQNDMYIEADVSERFIGDFKKGDHVEVFFPIVNRKIETSIIAVSEIINLENRTFKIEMRMPKVDFVVKPNQVVVIQLIDYTRDSTIVVPTELILSDADGKFLYVVEDQDNQQVAAKARISVGMTSEGKTEILDGLEIGDLVVLQGYRDLTEGTIVEQTEKSTETAKL
ncbi:efflux RND transporter periplasmic adaptor subunit [Fulvivirga sedimenti]|uniref:Efflux RND transporter periplasmic adaptor subunit n=1 Tax=Fulvivirga sedimenti TaxID=2879465 RepID=A0A9X1HWP5_9BACT|nr:efflux RND transporter periplasmic adaptor subunit [Fulvivirga sedimenti]MCA6075417.1 efflux RND transporter periplasmic adaptor subunit [Fulvivirga sedimenti]MCA6076594.1 efflux RND transporter periplasmic adaptor subunit [Fulvivirga sedimenti]MCA6077722.1 efflux RND transporter periplasmic adaptor subunit [Fulvivirga sedimenti]